MVRTGLWLCVAVNAFGIVVSLIRREWPLTLAYSAWCLSLGFVIAENAAREKHARELLGIITQLQDLMRKADHAATD